MAIVAELIAKLSADAGQFKLEMASASSATYDAEHDGSVSVRQAKRARESPIGRQVAQVVT